MFRLLSVKACLVKPSGCGEDGRPCAETSPVHRQPIPSGIVILCRRRPKRETGRKGERCAKTPEGRGQAGKQKGNAARGEENMRGGAGKMGRQASGLPPRARHAGAGKGCRGREKSDALRGVVI